VSLLKGADGSLVRALQEAGLRVRLVPVVHSR